MKERRKIRECNGRVNEWAMLVAAAAFVFMRTLSFLFVLVLLLWLFVRLVRLPWQQDKWLENPCMIVSHNKFSMLPNGFSLLNVPSKYEQAHTHTVTFSHECKKSWSLHLLQIKSMTNAMRVRNRDDEQKKPREEQRLANEKALFILIPFRFWVWNAGKAIAKRTKFFGIVLMWCHTRPSKLQCIRCAYNLLKKIKSGRVYVSVVARLIFAWFFCNFRKCSFF